MGGIGPDDEAGAHTARWHTVAGVVCALLAACGAVCGAPAFSQTPQQAWGQSVLAEGNADALPGAGEASFAKRSLAIDAAGNIIVTGSTNNGANTDFLTVKVSPTGTRLWRRTANGSGNGNDSAYAVAVDAAGNVAVAGASRGVANMDYLVVKYDPDGNELWRSTFTGLADGDDYAHDLRFAPNGDVYVTGVSFLSSFNNNHHYVTLRLRAADGVELWRAVLDGAAFGYDQANALWVGPDGLPVVSGYAQNASGASGGDSADYVTVKYDVGGNELWRSIMNGTAAGADIALALTGDAEGNLYVTGASSDGSYQDAVTVKIDGSSGAELWRRVANGLANRNDGGYAIAADAAGNVFVAGVTNQDFSVPASAGNPSHLLVKYSPSGAELWRVLRDGAGVGSDIASGLAVDGSGNVYFTAHASNGTSGELAAFKFDADGNELWRAPLSGIGPAQGAAFVSMATTAGGEPVAAGFRSNGSDNDFLVVKWSAAGSEQWRTDEGPATGLSTVLGAGSGNPGALAFDQAGNVFLAGRGGEGARADAVAAKLAADGSLQWQRSINGAGNGLDQAIAIGVDGAGALIVASDSYSGGSSDLLTVKFDAQGNELWRAIANGGAGAQDIVKSLGVDAAGDVVVAGASRANNGFDFFAVKYAGGSGAELWRATADGSANGDDVPAAMALDSAGNAYLAGRSMHGGLDAMWLVKLFANGAPAWQALVPSDGVVPRSVHGVVVDTGGTATVAGDLIVRFSQGGSELWRSSGGFTAHAIALGVDGGVVAGGSGGTVVRHDNSGAELWRVSISSGGVASSQDQISSIVVDALGAVTVVNRNSADPQARYTVIRLDAAGNELWRLPLDTNQGGAAVRPTLRLMPDRTVLVGGNAISGGAPAMSAWAIRQTLPAPVFNAALAGDGEITFYFDPPAGDGGSPISSYTISCNGGAAVFTAAAAPLTVNGLTNGLTYSCQVRANNAFGASAPSATLGATPLANAPLAMVGARLRLAHGAAGTHSLAVDITKPLGGAITVEPREPPGARTLTVRFSTTVGAVAGVSLTNQDGHSVGSSSSAIDGNEVTVTLTGAPAGQRLKLRLHGVHNGGTPFDVEVPFALLAGDVNANAKVTAADLAAIKARSGSPVSAANFRMDIDGNGSISAVDVSRAKARAGWQLP